MKPPCQTCGEPATEAVVDTHEYAEAGWLLSLPGQVRLGCASHPMGPSKSTRHASKEEAISAMAAENEAKKPFIKLGVEP